MDLVVLGGGQLRIMLFFLILGHREISVCQEEWLTQYAVNMSIEKQYGKAFKCKSDLNLRANF